MNVGSIPLNQIFKMLRGLNANSVTAFTQYIAGTFQRAENRARLADRIVVSALLAGTGWTAREE